MKLTSKSLAKLSGAVALVLSASALSAEELRFWTTEEQPERLARQEAMAAEFEKISGHSVEVIPVTENDLGKRANGQPPHLPLVTCPM